MEEGFRGVRLSVPGIVLLVLNNGPICRTKIQMEVFLAWNEFLGNRYATDPGFIPSQTGPYSQAIAKSLIILKSNSNIRVLARGEGHQTFVISDKGKITLAKELEQINIPNNLLSQLSDKKIDWDEWTTSGITEFVRRNYPYYIMQNSSLYSCAIFSITTCIRRPTITINPCIKNAPILDDDGEIMAFAHVLRKIVKPYNWLIMPNNPTNQTNNAGMCKILTDELIQIQQNRILPIIFKCLLEAPA